MSLLYRTLHSRAAQSLNNPDLLRVGNLKPEFQSRVMDLLPGFFVVLACEIVLMKLMASQGMRVVVNGSAELWRCFCKRVVAAETWEFVKRERRARVSRRWFWSEQGSVQCSAPGEGKGDVFLHPEFQGGRWQGRGDGGEERVLSLLWISWIQLRVSKFVMCTLTSPAERLSFLCMPSLPEIQGLGGRAVLAGGVRHCDAKVPVAFLAALCHHASHHLWSTGTVTPLSCRVCAGARLWGQPPPWCFPAGSGNELFPCSALGQPWELKPGGSRLWHSVSHLGFALCTVVSCSVCVTDALCGCDLVRAVNDVGNANNSTSYARLAAMLSGCLAVDGAAVGNYLRKGLCPFQLYQQVLSCLL